MDKENRIVSQGDISIWCHEGRHEQCDGIIDKDLPQPGRCICQCHFPQGDDEGLLTLEGWLKFFKVENAVQRRNAKAIYEAEKPRLKAQRDLTTRLIKQDEEEIRKSEGERIIEELEKHHFDEDEMDSGGKYQWFQVPDEVWQSLKKGE